VLRVAVPVVREVRAGNFRFSHMRDHWPGSYMACPLLGYHAFFAVLRESHRYLRSVESTYFGINVELNDVKIMPSGVPDVRLTRYGETGFGHPVRTRPTAFSRTVSGVNLQRHFLKRTPWQPVLRCREIVWSHTGQRII